MATSFCFLNELKAIFFMVSEEKEKREKKKWEDERFM